VVVRGKYEVCCCTKTIFAIWGALSVPWLLDRDHEKMEYDKPACEVILEEMSP
jgi:hypothetical protein